MMYAAGTAILEDQCRGGVPSRTGVPPTLRDETTIREEGSRRNMTYPSRHLVGGPGLGSGSNPGLGTFETF